MPFRIRYADPTLRHFEFLTAAQRSAVFEGVNTQLAYEPTKPTRNRKPMRPNRFATWELRIRKIRVYYNVLENPEPTVLIVAIGVKERNVVRIGGAVIKL